MSPPSDTTDLFNTMNQRIHPLPLNRIRTLLATAQQPKHRPIAPALGLMLWAGIRPGEIEQLTWNNINIADRIICIPPAQTEGARQILLRPVLYEWLRRTTYIGTSGIPIAPQGWQRRWRELRQASGFQHWQPDLLRHTFAIYHLKQFHDWQTLQQEMGHVSMECLRTRYLNIQDISDLDAACFWGDDPSRHENPSCL